MSERLEEEARTAPVLALRRCGPDLLVLELARPPDFHFRPGQAVSLAIGGDARPFSIASAPDAARLEFLVRIDGELATRLADLRPGSRLAVSPPFGSLQPDLRRPRQLLVAAGTGIAPYVSMLRDYLQRGRPRHHFHLLHGVSFADELAHAEELRALAARFPSHFRYLPCVSRPLAPRNAHWRGLDGRVESLLPAYVHSHDLTPKTTLVYACGHGGMVENVRRALAPLGYDLRTEVY